MWTPLHMEHLDPPATSSLPQKREKIKKNQLFKKKIKKVEISLLWAAKFDLGSQQPANLRSVMLSGTESSTERSPSFFYCYSYSYY